jgi:hypothetical protein
MVATDTAKDVIMAKNGRSLADLALEIERRAGAKRDLIAPVSKLEVATDGALMIRNGTDERYPLTDHAHAQLAEFTGIPMPYYRRMLAEQPDLVAVNANRWLHADPKSRRMVRTLDGKCRALLSDKFRLGLENEDLLGAAFPVLKELDLMVISCDVTERRMYVKAVDRAITRDVPTGRMMGDGSHVFFDTCSPAVSFGTSEVGDGAFYVEGAVWTHTCTNLATTATKVRKVHSGARHGTSDEVYALLTDETKDATDKALLMQVRDMVRGIFDRARFDAQCTRLGEAAGDKLPAKDAVEVVTRAARKFSWNETERDGILGTLLEGGDFTRYGLHAAVTRFSQADAVDYDRATELEKVGGDIIDLGADSWRELVAA